MPSSLFTYFAQWFEKANEVSKSADRERNRENLIYEILHENTQVAEISKEPGRGYEIEIYSAADNSSWQFDLNEFKAILEDGIAELANNRR